MTRAANVASLAPEVYRLGVADWLSLPEEGALQELIDGILIVTPAASVPHQRVVARLLVALASHLREHGGGEVLPAPTGVRLTEHDVLEPDLLVLLPGHRARATERYVEGAPDLVVEVLSPGSAGRDVGSKRAAYERAGVSEYWIVDPLARTVEVLALRTGRYEREALAGDHEPVRSSRLVGLRIEVGSLFA